MVCKNSSRFSVSVIHVQKENFYHIQLMAISTHKQMVSRSVQWAHLQYLVASTQIQTFWFRAAGNDLLCQNFELQGVALLLLSQHQLSGSKSTVGAP
jgi:hypothetical protein